MPWRRQFLTVIRLPDCTLLMVGLNLGPRPHADGACANNLSYSKEREKPPLGPLNLGRHLKLELEAFAGPTPERADLSLPFQIFSRVSIWILLPPSVNRLRFNGRAPELPFRRKPCPRRTQPAGRGVLCSLSRPCGQSREGEDLPPGAPKTLAE